LGQFVGSWRFMLISKGEAPENNWAFGGNTTGKWILDGRFIEQSFDAGAIDGSGRVKGRVLMTYDEKKRVYRIWSFFSEGTALETEGTWDQESRTMTWVYRSGQNEVTTTVQCEEDGIVKVKFVATERPEKNPGTVIGTFTLQKEQP